MIRFMAGLALILSLAAYAGFDEGVEAYSIGDYAKAMAEFKPLAERGDVIAEYFVGFFYHHGYGVPVDRAEAAKWYRKAAAQGDSRSQYYLGKMAEKGEGVDQSLTDAHVWLSLSAKNAPNERDAAYTRQDIQKLERKMSPEQIAKAKELASQWKVEK
jgi:TPR repeat protein